MNLYISDISSTTFNTENNQAIADYSMILLDTVKDAISQNNISSVSSELKKITELYERVGNILNIQDLKNEKCYLFGFIMALALLGEELADAEVEKDHVTELLSSYSRLLPILEIIASKDTISGVDLKKATGLKSNNLSNFMRRVKKFELISINKVGNTNYYSLTKKGQRFLAISYQTNQNSLTQNIEKEALICKVLDEISSQLLLNKPSAVPVMIAINSNGIMHIHGETLLKHKIESTFYSRDNYFRKKLEAISEEARENDKLAEVNDWENHYLSIKEHELAEYSGVSYLD